jgi:hypothetical protein
LANLDFKCHIFGIRIEASGPSQYHFPYNRFSTAVPTWEENVFEKYKSEYDWLTLERAEDQTYLGCSLCMKSESKKKRGFASGRYEVKKYFNQRTLQQHVDSPIHQTCFTKAKSSPSQPQDLGIVASSPSRPSSDKDPATPPRRMPSQSSEQATPSTSGKKETQTRRSFYNLMRGVYTTLHQCLSSCVFRILLSFAEACGGVLPQQQSGTVFEECRDLIIKKVKERLECAIRASPYFALSIDEKVTMLIIVVTFIGPNCEKLSAPLAYRNLAGMEASDLFASVKDTLEASLLDPANLVAFCADGASVMGTRKAMSDPRDGNNVARRLKAFCGHPILVQHCSPHKLQLAVEAAFHGDDYFKETEQRIRALFKHLKAHPSSNIDLVFWSELTGEDVLTPVSTSAARWLSWLRPLEKIHASFTALLAHLLYEFTHHANKEQKETIQWMFLFFCSWEFRLTIAGIIDVLRICFRSKNLLEKAKSLTAVCKLAGQLKEELDRYCRRNSLLADAMAGERALPAGDLGRVCL